MTATHLLSHTAGTTVDGFPGYSPRADIPTELQVLDGAPPANTAAVHVEVAPGTLHRYSGGGSTILQVALADAAGLPFSRVVEDWVLKPAGMSHSGFFQPPTRENAVNAARAHHRRGSPALDEELQDVSGSHPIAVRAVDPWHIYSELQAAGLWTTPGDLARFAIDIARAIQGDEDRVLSPATARLMTTEVTPGSDGLGFRMQERGEGQEEEWFFSHSGGNWGFRCNLMAHRLRGYGSVIMINGDNFEMILELQRRIAIAFGWDGDLYHLPRNWKAP